VPTGANVRCRYSPLYLFPQLAAHIPSLPFLPYRSISTGVAIAMSSRRRLPGSERDDLLPGGGDLADKSRRSFIASTLRFARRRPVTACVLVAVVAGALVLMFSALVYVPLPGIRSRATDQLSTDDTFPEDDLPPSRLQHGGLGAGAEAFPPVPDAAGQASSSGGGSTHGNNGQDVVPAAAPVTVTDGVVEDVPDGSTTSVRDGAADGSDGAAAADSGKVNWDGGGVEGGAATDADGASLGMGSVDGDGSTTTDGTGDVAGDAGGGDGTDGAEVAAGGTVTDASVGSGGAEREGSVGGGAPSVSELSRSTDLTAQVALMSSAPCKRMLQTGTLGSATPLCVTGEYFVDVKVGDAAPVDRITIGIFGQAVPKSAVNWHALATCSGGDDDPSCFRNDSFHRIVPNFVIQGGNHGTGRSVFGSTFREEVSADHHSVLSHTARGVVAWAEYPIGSQFYILMTDAADYLDKNHVVFGIVLDGLHVADKIQKLPLDNGAPTERVTIVSTGLLDAASTGPVPAAGSAAEAGEVGPIAPPALGAARVGDPPTRDEGGPDAVSADEPELLGAAAADPAGADAQELSGELPDRPRPGKVAL